MLVNGVQFNKPPLRIFSIIKDTSFRLNFQFTNKMSNLKSDNSIRAINKRNKKLLVEKQLIYVAGQIRFKSEQDLEDYIESNFN
ncbi:hypothetical protein NIES4071_69170 [Calothrix sp. NIES-4071]|nr:hypothetical protein NIES4071_69170 [Calothrix sp. NIES-4071]BAZ61194.1 hypothetical protein NIES4105_69120 [Calothrix sp. NIES-4105]